MKERALYDLRGHIQVEAGGYWFTAGGVKGSFGYYPHLKDERGLPVYPDTQVKGDLRMAVGWLARLEPSLAPHALINLVFGREGEQSSGLLDVGDLRLDAEDGERGCDLFQVRARVRIDPETKSVADKFLVEREYAYLEGRTLKAPVTLGYFDSVQARQGARSMVEAACRLLSGFGAGRSRGYGRGRVSFVVDEEFEVLPQEAPASDSDMLYCLENLTNFRNRVIAPGRTQILDADPVLREDVLLAWLARTYRQLWGAWPTPSEMASVRISPLHPTQAGELGLPAPASTRLGPHGLVDDWGVTLEQWQAADIDPKELSSVRFVTASEEPRHVDVSEGLRFRNAIGEDFRTKDSGLFLQQFITAGQAFSGRIRFSGDTAFTRRIRHILGNVMPRLNGTAFSPRITSLEPEPEPSAGVRVAIAPMPAGLDRLCAIADGERLRIGSVERYSTLHNRPRRQIIAIAPGSVVMPGKDGPFADRTAPWSGFGRISKPAPGCVAEDMDRIPSPRRFTLSADDLDGKLRVGIRLTASQAGIIRELAHPSLSDAVTVALMEAMRKKLDVQGGQQSAMLAIVEAALDLDAGLRKEWLGRVYDELTIRRWLDKPKSLEAAS